MKIIKSLSYAMLLFCSASYSQFAFNYAEFSKKFEYQQPTTSASHLVKLAGKDNEYKGYIELESDTGSDKFTDYKIKLHNQHWRLSTKIKGKVDSGLSKVSVIYTSPQTGLAQFIGEIESEVEYQAKSSKLYLLATPALHWNTVFNNAEFALSLKQEVFLLPCSCPNGQRHFFKESAIEWSMASYLSSQTRIEVGAKIKHKHVYHYTEKEINLSLKFYL